MTLTAVIAGKGAPGATTVTLAAAWSSQRPVIVVDADPFGGDVLPGMLAGRADNSGGLLQWHVATRRAGALEAAARLASFGVAVSSEVPMTVVAGIQSPSQAGTLAGSWDRIATALEHVEDHDVVVDLGRAHDQSAWPIVSAAEKTLLVVQPTTRSVQSALWVAAQLEQRLGDLDPVQLVVNGPGPYTPSEVGEALRFETHETIPTDRKAAAMLTEGAPFLERSLRRSRLVRAATGLLNPAATRQGVLA